MKKSLFLCLFFLGMASAGWANANPDPDNGDDPEETQTESTYEFSLSKAYLSIFNLFSLTAIKKDTVVVGGSPFYDVREDEARPK
ncbi:MAG: hypothetical protein HRT74_05240 [Flavobacteriales bacterium]|nr:hypothetical protein [Flavobacteriales bacterium]